MNIKHKIAVALCLIVLSANYAQAQNMWGTTESSKNGKGSIFKTNENGEVQKYYEVFPFNEGRNPYNVKLIEASANMLYGTCGSGGDSNQGIIYKYDIINGNVTVLHHFGVKNGTNIQSGMMKASNGKLYGVAASAGLYSSGSFYEFDPVSNSFRVLIHFKSTAGSTPVGLPIQGSNGKIYGTTLNGGASGLGVIYEFDINTQTSTVIHSFTNGFGSGPRGNLVEYNGALFGLTENGGSIGNNGVLFSLNMTTSAYTVLHNFTSLTEGGVPEYLMEKNGILYGNCRGGGSYGGTIFKYDIGDFNFSVLHMFTAQTGKNPSQISDGGNGYLYGVTDQGGANNFGVLYKISMASGNYAKIEDFTVEKARFTKAGVTKASNGKYYFSSNGGITSSGNILEYDTSKNTLTSIYSFAHAPNGESPYGKLLQIYGDKFIGITSYGGDYNNGTIYFWDASKEEMKVLHHINRVTDGGNDASDLLKGSNGKIYGTFQSGGKNNRGTFFTFNLASGSFDTLYNFASNDSFGSNPSRSLIEVNGALYGTCYNGGTNNLGTIFKYDLSTKIISNMYSFSNASGGYPFGMVLGNNNILYGTTSDYGTNNDGTFWEYNLGAQTFRKIKDLSNDTTGSYAQYLVKASNGNILVVAAYGGDNQEGTLFQYNTVSQQFKVVHHFTDTVIGNYPENGIMQAANGKIYGMCQSGGPSKFDVGTLFEYDMATEKIAIKTEFNGNVGYYPVYSTLAQMQTLGVEEIGKNSVCIAYPNPTKSNFTIVAEEDLTQVTIYDINGKMMYELNNINDKNVNISSENWSNGIYIIKAIGNLGVAQTIKILKQ